MSHRHDWAALHRSLTVLTVIFILLAIERLLNAAMAGSEVGIRTAWILSVSFALGGAVILCSSLLLSRGNNPRAAPMPRQARTRGKNDE
jgi:hypothetical protein